MNAPLPLMTQAHTPVTFNHARLVLPDEVREGSTPDWMSWRIRDAMLSQALSRGVAWDDGGERVSSVMKRTSALATLPPQTEFVYTT